MLNRLLDEAHRLGITVTHQPLAHPLRGYYQHHQKIIVIRKDLNRRQEIETLAHELGHAHHGHTETTPRTEAQAWKYAARLTVDPEAYAVAERINPHPAAIALELDLTPTLITAWQKYCLPHYERQVA